MFSPQSSSFQPNGQRLQPYLPSLFSLRETAINNDDFNPGSFSSGSSSIRYNRYEHSYFPAQAHASASSSPAGIDATGQEIAPRSRIAVQVQPIDDPPLYWQWTPLPAHLHPDSTLNVRRSPRSNKKALSIQEHTSPPADLPSSTTSMAVLFHPDAFSGGCQSHQPLPSPPNVNSDASRSPPTPIHSQQETDVYRHAAVSHSRPREKKHGCWMCHKSFDRPSTLRKHLLVHTGEKAFVCETCGRRFGVASNLNRHVRRCILRPVNSQTSAVEGDDPRTGSPSTARQESQSGAATSASSAASDPASASQSKCKRTRSAAATASHSGSLNQSESQVQSHPRGGGGGPPPVEPKQRPAAKRRRRAPSPTPWIPFSLLAFDLNPVEFHKSTPVPLPPVSPSMMGRWVEERNSWDENVGLAPYHRDWTGKLPGPGLAMGMGLGGRDVGNLALGTGGYFMGRLSLF